MHNRNIYVGRIKSFIPTVKEDDIRFISNRAARLFRKIPIDSEHTFRVKMVDDETSEYHFALSLARCPCGTACIEKTVSNPKTGNTFVIAFNYSLRKQ